MNIIYSPQDSLIDTQRLLNALGMLKGTVHHMTFPTVLEVVILGQAGQD
jgi:hypothetical protein